MNFFINIALTGLILFQGMFAYVDFSFELGELVEDYKIHQTKYGDDLATFISKHFGDLREQHKEEHQKEHQEHKHHNSTEINVHLDFICLANFVELSNRKEIIFKQNNFSYKNLFSTFEKQKIFQPPRV